jgi:predicted RNase H-like HicB family nuclease
MVQKHALPLTFLLAYDEEAKAWASFACEISVASCGDSVDDAREMLKEAVEIHVSSMVETDHLADLSRPPEPDYLAEYFSGDGVVTEYHTLFVVVETEPGPRAALLEFVPSAVAPFCPHQRAAA